jgi:hypothetical protein
MFTVMDCQVHDFSLQIMMAMMSTSREYCRGFLGAVVSPLHMGLEFFNRMARNELRIT